MLKLLAVAVAACVAVSPSGKMITQTPKVAAFHSVAIGGGMEANVSRGAMSVKIEADEAVMPYIEAKVDSDGVLNLSVNSKGTLFMRTGKIAVTITSPTLDGVEASGGSNVHAMMTAAKQCKVSGSGGSDVTLAGLTCEQLMIDVSGGSTLQAVGTAKKIVISASGGSKAGVRQVAASVVSVEGSGASEIRTFASAELTAELSGGSELFVAGHPPSRKVEASGGAQIVDIP